jgi:hypothetical protein
VAGQKDTNKGVDKKSKAIQKKSPTKEEVKVAVSPKKPAKKKV